MYFADIGTLIMTKRAKQEDKTTSRRLDPKWNMS